MFLFLLHLVFALSPSHFNTPDTASLHCELRDYPEIILVGELHYSANATFSENHIKAALVSRGRASYLIEGPSIADSRYIDNILFRYHIQVIHFALELKNENLKATTIALTNLLHEASFYPQLLSVDTSDFEEKQVLLSLNNYAKRLRLLSSSSDLEITRDIYYFVKERRDILKKIVPKWLETSSLFAFSHASSHTSSYLPDVSPQLRLFSKEDVLENISYRQLKKNAEALNYAREVFMAQKILDYACNHPDKPIFVKVGNSHIASLNKLLGAAYPQDSLESFNIIVTTWFLEQKIKQLKNLDLLQ